MGYKYKVPKFLRRDNASLLFNLPNSEMIIYVPEIYFDREDAIIIGEYVNLIGIADYAIFTNGKHNGLKSFNYPTAVVTKPYEVEKVTGIKLKSTSEPEDYRLLKFKYNDIVIDSVMTEQNVDNVEDFYRILFCGKLPKTIPYNELHKYPYESMTLNGEKYNMSMQYVGILISQLCRDKKNLDKPFRLSKNNNMLDYDTMSIKDVPKYTDVFMALTSENWDKSVVGAITNEIHKDSPMEALLTEGVVEV